MLFSHKIFKVILIGLISLFVIVSVAIIILVNSVNPNKYKPLIIESVNNSTGRQLHLDGNISWQIWPNIGLQVKQISLSNPEGFAGKNFVEMQSASISLNLIPLFRNKIVINDLSIHGLKLALVEENNKNNWTFTPKSHQSKNKESSVIDFELHSFSLADSEITYNNLVSKSHKELKNFNFALDTPSDGGIRFNGKTGRLNLDNVNFNLNDNLKGTIQLDLHDEPKLSYTGKVMLSQFSLNQLLSKLNMKPINIKNKAILDNVSFNTDFDGTDKYLNLPDLKLNIDQSKFQGLVKINNFMPLALQNDININQLEASDWINTNGYKLPMSNINLHGTANNANLGITKMGVQQNLKVNNILLYGINIQDRINYAEKTLTVSQFANPVKLFERLDSMLSPSEYTKKDLKQKTNLGKLSTGITVKNGILTTPGFLLNGPTLRVSNSGDINFNKRYINYNTYTKIVSIPANSLLGSLTYPYEIQGNLDNPDTSVDKISLQKQVFAYYGEETGNVTTGAAKSVKQGTVHLWNKIFH